MNIKAVAPALAILRVERKLAVRTILDTLLENHFAVVPGIICL